MGMPINLEIVNGSKEALDTIFDYFVSIDKRFSTYKPESEIMKINRKECTPLDYSEEMKEVLMLGEKTKKETNGYFSITKHSGFIDPSGIVKGWAIRNAAVQLNRMGYNNYFLDVGGDIQSSGVNSENSEWTIGIRNPFNLNEIIKVLFPRGSGVATSGTYIRGQHIYNPYVLNSEILDIVSFTVVGPDVFEADRFATAAFVMEMEGITFIENLNGFEGYLIDSHGIATMTSGFNQFTT